MQHVNCGSLLLRFLWVAVSASTLSPIFMSRCMLQQSGMLSVAEQFAADCQGPHTGVLTLHLRTGGQLLGCPSIAGRKVGCLSQSFILHLLAYSSFSSTSHHACLPLPAGCSSTLRWAAPPDPRHKLNTLAAAALCSPQQPACLPAPFASTGQAAGRTCKADATLEFVELLPLQARAHALGGPCTKHLPQQTPLRRRLGLQQR